MNRQLLSLRQCAQGFLLVLGGVAALATFTATITAGGCTDDSNEPRRGFAGDSCLTTNDCVAPLSCVANVCGGGSGGSGGGGSSSSSSGSGGPLPDAGTSSQCDQCLDTKCEGELAACDVECIALEACIETLCKHLGEIGSPDEGACFVNCQNAHPKAKNKHLAVVDCSQTGNCLPPCVPYPQAYDECRAFMDADLCKSALDMCNASADCKNYSDCVSLCATAAECIACDDTPEGQNGRNLRESYELCVAAECISESWLPNSI